MTLMLPQNRMTYVMGALLVSLLAVFVSLIPKPENDLFFILRTGNDILRTHTLPHTDTYSWTNPGTRWDVPEWGAFVLYALAYRGAQFFGTWALMAGMTAAAALVVYGWLARRAGAGIAFGLTSLMLLALSPFVQERPYAFTYLLLPIGLIVLTRARDGGSSRLLLLLPPLCALWANLHQGVLAFVALLGICALGDVVSRSKVQAARIALLTGVCALAVCISPYGTGIYRNVFVTLHSTAMTASVTEWRPVYTVPVSQLLPFLALVVLIGATFVVSRPRSVTELFLVTALFAEAVLHARNIALFVLGGLIVIGPHLQSLTANSGGLRDIGARRKPLLMAFALLFFGLIGTITLATLRRDDGRRGLSAEGIGEAVARVPRYPESVCGFMQKERFPTNLRLLNSFENGGFLLWRMPMQPVFIDGRLDVYVGRTFDDNLILAQSHETPAWTSLVKHYDFDCILTTRPATTALFAADPQYQLVYADTDGPHSQRARLFLRCCPQFTALAARCLHDRPL